MNELLKHKDKHVTEIHSDSKKWWRAWIKTTKSFWEIALKYSGDFNENANNLKEKLSELSDLANNGMLNYIFSHYFNIDINIDFLSELNSQTAKLITFNIKEDNKLIKELTKSSNTIGDETSQVKSERGMNI